MSKGILSFFVFALGLVGTAHAADLPTKAPDAPPSAAPSCFGSFWDYMNASVRDCPLRYGPITLYGTLDGGYGYELWGTPVGQSADKPNYAIQRNSGNTHWLWSPNGLSTSTVGLRLAQPIGNGFEIVGVAEAGFNPYSLQLLSGPQSLVDNNLYAPVNQTTHFDTARNGLWDNGQGFIGVSNKDYGTLTFGRTMLLSQSALSTYDPVASVAFSQIGFTALYSTFGASPTSRINTALTYRLTYQDFRIAAQAQVGGYDQGNAASSEYQAQAGIDIGKFSFDAIAGYAQNALTFQTFGGATMPAGFDPDSILRATAFNTGGIELLGRYQWEKFKFYLGYIYSRSTNPSQTYFPFGVPSVAPGIGAPPGFITTNAYTVPRELNTVWTGLRYAVTKTVEIASGVYWEIQNDFLAPPAVCTGSGTTTSSTRCSGGRYSYSFLAEYKPVPRLTIYGGVLVSNVYGGVASGYMHTENVAPTIGTRFQF
jgi:predicted porin